MPKLKTKIEIEIEVQFDYHKAEPETKDSPGCPEEVALDTIKGPGEVSTVMFLWKREDEIEDLIWVNRDSWED